MHVVVSPLFVYLHKQDIKVRSYRLDVHAQSVNWSRGGEQYYTKVMCLTDGINNAKIEI